MSVSDKQNRYIICKKMQKKSRLVNILFYLNRLLYIAAVGAVMKIQRKVVAGQPCFHRPPFLCSGSDHDTATTCSKVFTYVCNKNPITYITSNPHLNY